MPSPRKNRILVGAGHLYYASPVPPAVTVNPPDPTTDLSYLHTMDNATGWTYAGATQEGLEVAYEPDYGEVEVDQMKSAIKMFNQGLTVSVNTNLAEATLKNLLVAWGQVDEALDATSGTFTIGDPEDDPVERAIVMVGNAPTEDAGAGERAQRVYTGWRCVSVEGSTHALRRTEATVFPVSFRLLPISPDELTAADVDLENVDARLAARPQYGRIQDRTFTDDVPATPPG